MRYSRMKEYSEQKEKNSKAKSGGIFLVCIVIAAILYIITATKAGSLISEKVIAPALNFFAEKTDHEKAEEAVSSAAELNSMVSAELSFPALNQYLLQSGIFSEKENAEKASKELTAIGGAGYIREEDGQYRVLISGYDSKEDAESVKSRLKNERSMETKILEISGKAMICTISCEESYAETVKQAAEFVSGLHTELLSTVLEFDKGNLSQSAACEAALNMHGAAEEHLKSLEEVAEKTTDPLVAALLENLRSAENSLAEMDSEQSGVELSSALKRAYAATTYSYRDLLEYDTKD